MDENGADPIPRGSMTTRKEYSTCVKKHITKRLSRKECAVNRLMTVHQTTFKGHSFIFIQHLMRVMSCEQLEEVIGAVDHG